MAGFRLIVTSILLIAVPVAFLVWLRASTDERLDALEPDPVALVSPVEIRADDELATVTVTGNWNQPDTLVAPAWQGLVTSVAIKLGDVVEIGDVIATIDGIHRVGVASLEPFWRTLRRGDTGPDVKMLQKHLAQLALYKGDIDGSYGRLLETAVKEWAAGLGAHKPDGSFDPAWTVWLTPDPFQVESVDLQPGSPAPPVGSTIAASPAQLASVSLVGIDGSAFVANGRWTLEIQGEDFSLVEGQPTESGLEMLAAILPIDGPPPVARVRLTDPVERLTVPATSVVTTYDGTFCVYVQSGSGFAPKHVEVGSSKLSTIDIVQGIDLGDEILANPSDILNSPDCE